MTALHSFNEFFTANPTVFIVLASTVGLLVGSFLNVVIYRLPVMMEREWTSYALEFLREAKSNPTLSELHPISEQLTELTAESDTEAPTFNLMLPASHCPQCDHKIRWWENIPVISYLGLGGKCSGCKKPIHWRYPAVELVTGLLSLCVAITFGFSLMTLLGLILTWSLVSLTMIDFDHKLLPDQITLPLLWLGILVNIPGTIVPLHDAVIGAIAGYLSLWSVFWIFKVVTGKEGMGYGDFKLLAALGAWIGWSALPMIIVLSSLVGAVVGISLIVITGRDKNVPIPFGPYLAAAGWIGFVFGDSLSSGYLSFLS